MVKKVDFPEIVLIVRNGDKLSTRGALNVEKWCRRQGAFIVRQKDNLAKQFRATISGGGLEHKKKGDR